MDQVFSSCARKNQQAGETIFRFGYVHDNGRWSTFLYLSGLDSTLPGRAAADDAADEAIINEEQEELEIERFNMVPIGNLAMEVDLSEIPDEQVRSNLASRRNCMQMIRRYNNMGDVLVVKEFIINISHLMDLTSVPSELSKPQPNLNSI